MKLIILVFLSVAAKLSWADTCEDNDVNCKHWVPRDCVTGWYVKETARKVATFVEVGWLSISSMCNYSSTISKHVQLQFYSFQACLFFGCIGNGICHNYNFSTVTEGDEFIRINSEYI